MVETVESLGFQAAPQNHNSISEPENLEIASGQERVGCSFIQNSDDTEIVDTLHNYRLSTDIHHDADSVPRPMQT